MMFVPEDVCFSWTFNPTTRGKLKGRQTLVKKGYYILEHVATGKMLFGTSKDVTTDVDKILALVWAGKHRSSAFCKLVQSDSELRVHECPCSSMRDAQRHIQAVRDSNHPYLEIL